MIPHQESLSVLLAGAVFVQLIYYLFIFSRLAFLKGNPGKASTQRSVSVVICARNEEKNLSQYLTSILNQDYPDFEVLVVNDRSSDQSSQLLEKMCAKHKHMRVIHIESDDLEKAGKKQALWTGVNAAKHDLILVSDADCCPSSPRWIHTMIQSMEDKEVVLGYAPLRSEAGLLSVLIQSENFFTALQYLSFALAGRAYMGVGRNMLFTKELFLRHFQEVLQTSTASGDDDLFISRVMKNEITVCTDHNAQMISDGPKNIHEFIRQKTRHLTAGIHYSLLTLLILGLYAFSLILLCGLNLYLLSADLYTSQIAAIMMFYLFISLFIKYRCMKKLHPHPPVYLIVSDLFYLMYQVCLIPLSLIRNKKSW